MFAADEIRVVVWMSNEADNIFFALGQWHLTALPYRGRVASLPGED